MLAYVDSSAALRYLIDNDQAFRQVQACHRVVSSELMEIECRRTILRDKATGRLDDENFVRTWEALETLKQELELFEMSAPIKRRAMQVFPVHVKTLDALHLATALAISAALVDEQVIVFSYDQTMNRAARALGLAAPWYQPTLG